MLARKSANYDPIVKEINDAGGNAIGISTDCSDGKSVKDAFAQIKKEMGSQKLAAAIYNVGGRFIRKSFLELDEEEFESGWVANGSVPWTRLSEGDIRLRTDTEQTRELPLLSGSASVAVGRCLIRIVPSHTDLHICDRCKYVGLPSQRKSCSELMILQ